MSNDHIADSGEKVPEMNESEIDDFIEILVRATVLGAKHPLFDIDKVCKSNIRLIKQVIINASKYRVCDNCDNYGWILKKCMLFDEMLDNPERQSCTEFKPKVG